MILAITLLIGVMLPKQYVKAYNYTNDFSVLDAGTYYSQIKYIYSQNVYNQYITIEDDIVYYSPGLTFNFDTFYELTPGNHYNDIKNDFLGSEYQGGNYVIFNFIPTTIFYFNIGGEKYRMLNIFYEYEIDNDSDTNLINHFQFNRTVIYFTRTGWDYYFGDLGLPDSLFADLGYDDGYADGRADYGEYFPAGSPDGFYGWYGFQDGYDYGLDVGYTNGVKVNNQEAYDKGYDDGLHDNFIDGLDKWIVPAIILVLIGGGFISFAKYRGRKNE